MPPRTKAPASEVEKYHLQIPMHLQLLYSMILEMGAPVGHDAWMRVISRLPLSEKEGKPMSVRACWGRWMSLKERWDKEMLFGEDHEEMVKEAVAVKEKAGGKKEKKDGGVKKAKTKAQGKAKVKGKGKGKEKAMENEEEEDSAGEGPSECQMVDDDEEAEASEFGEPIAKKARVTKAKKQTKKKAPIKATKDKEDEEESEAEAGQESEDEA